MKQKAKIFETEFADNFQPNLVERVVQQLEKNRKQVIISLCPSKVNRLVDLACGDGELLKRLAKKSDKLIGLDISQKRLKNAQAKLKKFNKKVTLKKIDLDNKLPIKKETVDLVICEASLQYFARPQALLQESSRILKSKGILIIQVPNAISLINRLRILIGKLPRTSGFAGIWDGGALHYFTHDKLRQALQLAGFKTLVTTGSGVWPQARQVWPELLSSDIIVKAQKK